MKKLLFYWNELKATFWFVPVFIILLSIFLAIALLVADSLVEVPKNGLARFFFVESSDSAKLILSTIAGAMIGVAGTVFSVTLVALTLASNQFGPRLIKNFMYVRLNQVVLGSYIATYLYCLLILNALEDSNQAAFIPSLSILVALIFAVLNIILLIVFIHQIATSIQADRVVADIADFIAEQVQLLFPEKMGEELETEEPISLDHIKSTYPEVTPLLSPSNGYLQYIDSEQLVRTVTQLEGLLDLEQRPGAYLIEGMVIGQVYTQVPLEETQLKRLTNHLVIGKVKMTQQDLEFSIHQMVEMAARALSPGVNDPFTAITCIDNLAATLCYLAQAKFPSNCRFDQEENLRVITDVVDFSGVLDAAYNQIRQFAAGSPAVLIRLLEALYKIAEFVRRPDHREAVAKHTRMVLRQAKQSMQEENDLQDLQARAQLLEERLGVEL